MTATLLGTFEPGSDAWHAARLTGLGGSEIAAVLGLSPWESRYALFQRKRGRIPPADLRDVMEWGTRLESAILGKFTDEHPDLWVRPAPGTFASIERPWQIANPDAVYADTEESMIRGIVEVKTAYDDHEWGDPGTDQIPPYYLAQCRWYLDVLGLDTCWVAVLIRGVDYREYLIRPNPEDTQLLRDVGEQFIEDIRAGRTPDIDSSDATYRAVKQLADGVVDDDVELDPDLADRYRAAVEGAKVAKVEKQHVTSLVLDAIGDRTRATSGGIHVATRSISKATGRTHALMPAQHVTPTKETTDA